MLSLPQKVNSVSLICKWGILGSYFQIGSSQRGLQSGASWLIVLVHLGTVVRVAGESWVIGLMNVGDVVCITEKLLANFFGNI